MDPAGRDDDDTEVEWANGATVEDAKAFCRNEVGAHETRLSCGAADVANYFEACMGGYVLATLNACETEWASYWTCVGDESDDCRYIWKGCLEQLRIERAACREPCAAPEGPPADFSCSACGTYEDPPDTWRCPGQ